MYFTTSMLEIERDVDGYFTPFTVGAIDETRWAVSVQASRTHYCSPRETLPKLSDYRQVEVLIMLRDGCKISMDDLSEFMPADIYTRFHYQGDGDYMASWLPTDKVEVVVNALSAAYLKQHMTQAPGPR